MLRRPDVVLLRRLPLVRVPDEPGDVRGRPLPELGQNRRVGVAKPVGADDPHLGLLAHPLHQPVQPLALPRLPRPAVRPEDEVLGPLPVDESGEVVREVLGKVHGPPASRRLHVPPLDLVLVVALDVPNPDAPGPEVAVRDADMPHLAGPKPAEDGQHRSHPLQRLRQRRRGGEVLLHLADVAQLRLPPPELPPGALAAPRQFDRVDEVTRVAGKVALPDRPREELGHRVVAALPAREREVTEPFKVLLHPLNVDALHGRVRVRGREEAHVGGRPLERSLAPALRLLLLLQPSVDGVRDAELPVERDAEVEPARLHELVGFAFRTRVVRRSRTACLNLDNSPHGSVSVLFSIGSEDPGSLFLSTHAVFSTWQGATDASPTVAQADRGGTGVPVRRATTASLTPDRTAASASAIASGGAWIGAPRQVRPTRPVSPGVSTPMRGPCAAISRTTGSEARAR